MQPPQPPSPTHVAPRPTPSPYPELRWHERLNVLSVTLLLFGFAVLVSLPAVRGPDRELNYLANARRFLGYFFPPDFSVAGQAMGALWETFQIAVMATAFAAVLSLPLAAMGAQNLAPRPCVWLARLILNVVRTVPSLIWALIGVAVVGANPLAGVIGLTFYSIGYLGKFFSDAFESVDVTMARGLRAIGASPVQAFQHGVWPHAKPLVWSHVLWMLEYNLRSASIIGIVGAGGVGTLLHGFQEYYAWEKFAAVLFFILVMVTALDLLGERVRRRITQRLQTSDRS